MKFKINSTVNYNDIDLNNKILLSTLARLQQKAATLHSDNVGYTNNFFVEKGLTWVLQKLHLKINRYPTLYENYEFITWSKGAKGYFAFRDYEMIINNETVITGCSVWLLIDINKKKPIRVSDEIVNRYTVENVDSMDSDIYKFKVSKDGETVFEKRYTLRYRDFDRNKHLNNSVYFEFIEDAVYEFSKKNIKEIKIMYQKEIPFGISDVNLSLKRQNNSLIFQIEDYAAGEIFI
ncbi:acyl-acyl carrier protein thioesterase [Deferribacter desulfuricans SSM1]|uniref:Acyl-acyl carrier protein thioesterase n=1 Tax=Deferribacter desulfuricans (strain DSM 14783 / JCM 11476 / NBRC 101012 / SSM1) TaxID=639282 RepID=D3PAB5_DEFDS|nr:acyl-ACP thioesterase domain-containing protein [Deferribacter desulfuricans]BAI79538.1 acyl-acyl carrier protein thioesterase [Deferribacter desulfuricans SSM1]